MPSLQPVPIEIWAPDAANVSRDIESLANLLHACVHAWASVSFVLPFFGKQAPAFWGQQVLPQAQAGTRCVLLARSQDQILGTVQIDFDTPPNQPHRAEVKKLLVHPKARRQGIARALMTAAEDHARAANRTLLTLDTAVGSFADPLYRTMGYQAAGVIPGYAYNFDSTALEATTVMYKRL